MPNLSINGALNKVYLRQKPRTKDFEDFSNQLENLKDSIEKGISLNESEENFKNLINDFLKESFYKRTNLINTKKRIDSAIYKTLDSNSPVQVLIEAKRPGSNEFPTEKNLNTKAMQEALLYFLRERILWKNIDLKHIVITNGFEWFLFDASEFQTHFYNDKKLLSRYDEFEVNPSLLFDKTSDFYKDIAAPFINKVKTQINYVYFDIRLLSERQKIGVYKLLSPEHLLRKFFCNDSNELNTPFYNELLYILGLEEYESEEDKKIRIRRLVTNRQQASFIENTINQIEDEVPNDEQQFEIALSLSITWINRILFLKLLESQLINYNKGNNEYRFLNSDTINGFDDLHELFFKVLAVPTNERKPDVVKKYKNIPYLNSSLFELTDNERILKISGLRDDKLPLHKQTILRDSRNSKRLNGELPVLEYLFRFLDAYDFGSEPNDDSLTRDERKTLINASVLGLIFEKINGYKDGSYFTPGQITAYMCHEALRSAVVQKFNEAYGWNCQTFDELADKNLDKTEANKIINSLRICDPAVGSGHFLVSALNELISIKSDLQVLMLKNGKRLKYSVGVENDELIILDDDREVFAYNPQNAESQLVQESLFEEKRAIIENCLFGVDINPNSVNICRLRLWIELLKNAYYKRDGEFETLPNIDINIKCGDSINSYYPVKIGEPISNNADLKKEISEYKACVKSYKYESNKAEKQKVKEAINKIKHKIAPGVQLSLELEAKDVEANRNAMAMNKYRNSMEWMIEFPEVLDENGIFMGFDAILGNPPYFQMLKGVVSANSFPYSEGKDEGKQNIYKLFVELSYNLLCNNRISCLITQSSLMCDKTATHTRELLLTKTELQQVIEFPKVAPHPEGQLFKGALVGTSILFYKKAHPSQDHSFFISANNDLTTINNFDFAEMQQSKPLTFYPKGYFFPLIRRKDFNVVEKMNMDTNFLEHYIEKSSQGDFNLTSEKFCFTTNPTDVKMYRGCHVHRYYIDNDVKEYIQGEYKKEIIKGNTSNTYLVCQQISGMTDKKRFNVALSKQDKCLFGNSVNKLKLKDTVNAKYILAIINSNLIDWYFRKTSTNNHINIYELEQLPIPNAATELQQPIIALVDQILAAKKQDPQADTTEFEHEIDLLVYHLYGLTFDEVNLIDESVTEEGYTATL